MKIVNSEPPDWIMKGCLDKFRVHVEQTVWTYGDTIFAPDRDSSLPDHIIAHEEQHARQQSNQELMLKYIEPTERIDDEKLAGKMRDAWWKEFLSNPRFRLEQEAEAYGAQYRFYCERVKDRNRRALFLVQLARTLSGPLYQVAVTNAQARKMIEVLSGQKQL